MAASVYFFGALAASGGSNSPLEELVVSEPPLMLVAGGEGLWLSGLELFPMTLELRLLEEQLLTPGGPLCFSSKRRLKEKISCLFTFVEKG